MLRLLSAVALVTFTFAAAAQAADDPPASQPEGAVKVQIKLVAASEKPAENVIPSDGWITQIVTKAGLGGAGDASDWTDIGAEATPIVSWPPMTRRFKAAVRKDSGDAFLVVTITGDANKTVMLLNREGQRELLKVDGLPRGGTLYLAVAVVPASSRPPVMWGEKCGDVRMNLRADSVVWPAKGHVALVGLYEHSGEKSIQLPDWGSEAHPPLTIADAAGRPVEPTVGKVEIPKKDEPDKVETLLADSVQAALTSGEIADGVLTIKVEKIGKSWSWRLPAGEFEVRAKAVSFEPAGETIISQPVRVQVAK
ncbi:MAG: hypothetical protein PHU85_09530 [Phycisphaerae bacterium]|nr:hypothetical protein [Phycisphaerae bacterium]